MQFLSCNKDKKITLPSTRIHKYIPFVDLQKALIMFRVVGLDFINNKGYESAESKIGTNNEFSYKFPVNVGVHKVLSHSCPLLYRKHSRVNLEQAARGSCYMWTI